MAKKLIRFEVDEDIYLRAAVNCKIIELDIQTYLTMCLKRLVSENGLPFSCKSQVKNNQKELTLYIKNRAVKEIDRTVFSYKLLTKKSGVQKL